MNDNILQYIIEKYTNKEEGVRGEVTQLRRIADILDEILKLVKQDMEKYEKKKH